MTIYSSFEIYLKDGYVIIILDISSFFSKKNIVSLIESLGLLIDCWPQFHLFPGRGDRTSGQFMGDMLSERHVSQLLFGSKTRITATNQYLPKFLMMPDCD